MTATLLFTTSWDDGHPLDLRLAELLRTHGFAGTFYVPTRNSEGRPVLSDAELRALAELAEIGGHTADHRRLPAMAAADAAAQIAANRDHLAQSTGREVTGFCYPGGRFSAATRQAVIDAGYDYARTIEGFRVTAGRDPYALPTTAQCVPHGWPALARNLLRRGLSPSRVRYFWLLASGGAPADRLVAALDAAIADPDATVFHLWGHSWELEDYGLWSELERFLAAAAGRVAAGNRVANRDVAARAGPSA